MLKWFLRGKKFTSPDGDGTSTATTEPTDSFSTGIKLLHTPAIHVINIVFVHGLTSDRDKTWKALDAKCPWPQDLLPAKIPNARVLSFGYDASVSDWRRMVSQNRIGNHAGNLLTTLATYRENDNTNEKPIIFVCHSLGGLVCEDALITARQRPEVHLQNILRFTQGIAFLGTPHHRAGLAQWAELLARHLNFFKQANAQIVAVLQAESEVLARIQDSFHTMIRSRDQDALPPIEITYFYEELPVVGVGVIVPSHSAILPGYIPISIRANHMDMTKFGSEHDPGFIAVVGELRRWARALNSHARTYQQRGQWQDSTERRAAVPTPITQSSSTGPTTISGGMVFQGNIVGNQPELYRAC